MADEKKTYTLAEVRQLQMPKAGKNATQTNAFWSKEIYADPNTPPIIYETGTKTFWVYRDGVFVAADVEDISFLVRSFLYTKEKHNRHKMSGYEDIAIQMTGEGVRVDSIDDRWLCFTDTLYNPDTEERAPIPSALEVKEAIAKRTKIKIATVKIPCAFSELATTSGPFFDKYMDSICVDHELKPDPKMKAQLQEIMGYCLLPSAGRAMSFFFTGAGRNGKGVYGEILSALLGQNRVSHYTLRQLIDDNFAKAGLVSKRVNYADESDTMHDHASDLFKKLVSADAITCRRIFGKDFTFKPRVKFFFCMNGMMSFTSWDYALKERILPVIFHRRFEKHERDWTLADKITENEMPHVVAFALAGLASLKQKNFDFSITTYARDFLAAMEDASSSTSEFCHEFYEVSDERKPIADVYAEYVTWARESGRKATSKIRFVREMVNIIGKPAQITFTRKPDGTPTTAKCLCISKIKGKILPISEQSALALDPNF